MNLKTNPHHKLLQLTILLTLCVFVGTTFGQSTEVTKLDERHRTFDSKLMKREMSYRVILPKDYAKNKDARYPVIYFLHGASFTRNRGPKYKTSYSSPFLMKSFARHDFIFVMHETGNTGFYTDSATLPDNKYESYFIREVIPEVDKNFRTIAERKYRFIAGASMGGYGALKFGLKYPDKFSLIGSFAGAIGSSSATAKNFGARGKVLDGVFGPLGSATRTTNNLFKLVENLTPDQIKALPMIYQSCGTEDFLIGGNRKFLSLLQKKKVRHEYRELPGGHRTVFFDPQRAEFIELAARQLNRK